MAAALHSWKILAVCWKYIIYIWKFSCRTFLRYCCKKKGMLFCNSVREILGWFLPQRENIWSNIVWIADCKLPLKRALLGPFHLQKGNKIWLGEDFTELKLGPEVKISCSLKWILTFLLCWIYLQPATDIACYLIVAQMSVNSKEL